MRPSKDEILGFLNAILEKRKLGTNEAYEQIENSFFRYSIPIPTIPLAKGMFLYRARHHESNEDYFEKISDISHRLDIKNITQYGRANKPNQSVFYCCDEPSLAFIETSKIVREKLELDSEKYTIGVWQTQEDIVVGYLPLNNLNKSLNKTAEQLDYHFNKMIGDEEDEKIELVRLVLDFLSREFSSTNNSANFNYLISCAFANYVYKINGHDYNTRRAAKAFGLIYPSVIYRNSGINLALLPHLIDDKKVKLVSAFRKKCSKICYKTYKDTELIKSKKVDNEKGIILW